MTMQARSTRLNLPKRSFTPVELEASASRRSGCEFEAEATGLLPLPNLNRGVSMRCTLGDLAASLQVEVHR